MPRPDYQSCHVRTQNDILHSIHFICGPQNFVSAPVIPFGFELGWTGLGLGLGGLETRV